MAEEIFTTQELAEYMKVNEKTVIKLAQAGDLPGFKVGNQWRFSWTMIDRYMNGHVFDSSDENMDIILKTKDHIIPFSRLTDETIINLDLRADSKRKVISELARMSHTARLTPSYEGLYIALEEREKLLSTAVGQGVALPHPRFPDQMTFKEPHIVIARSKIGVEYDAPDNKKVHLFFMPCSQSQFVHLRLLAKISKLLHIPNVIDRFMQVTSAKEIIQILMALEQEHLLPTDDTNHVQKVIDEQNEVQERQK